MKLGDKYHRPKRIKKELDDKDREKEIADAKLVDVEQTGYSRKHKGGMITFY